MERILCPVYFESYSHTQVLQALHMAAGTPRKVILLGILPSDVVGAPSEDQLDYFRQEMQKDLAKLAELVFSDAQFAGVKVDSLIKVQSYSTAVFDYVAKNKVDFLVLTPNPKADMFSEVELLFDELEVPIFVIPNDQPPRPLRRLVYGTDYSEADVRTIQKLIGFVLPFRSEVRVVHLTSSQSERSRQHFQEFKEKVNSFVSYPHLFFTLREHDGATEMELQKFISEVKGDFLVMLTHRKGFLEQILRKSTTKSVLQGLKYPIMVYKYREV